MATKSNHINILQADSQQISLLRVRRSASAVDVATYEVERGPWSDGVEGLRAALKSFADKHGLAGEQVCSVVPRYDITTRILTLPSDDESEIESMIKLSAEEYVPFAQSEIIVDATILATLPDGSSRVLAAFAHKDGIEAHIELLRSAGIDVDEVYLSTACLVSAVKGAGPPPEERFGLVNLGASGIEVLLFGPQGLEYSRAVATVQDWSLEGDASDVALEEFTVEVKASLSAHRRESEEGLTAESMFVCSEGAPVQSICDTAVHELTIECYPATFSSQLLKDGDKPAPPLILLGAALTAQGRALARLNLIPSSVRQAREQAGMRRAMIKGGAMVAAVLVAMLGLYIQAVVQRTQYIAQLEKANAAIAPQAESTKIKQRQLMILRRQVEASAGVMELLAKAVELAPPGTNITEFSYDMNSGISIIGRATSENLATNYADKLRSASDEFPVLSQARTPSTRTAQEFNQTVYEYEIFIPFPEDEEAEPAPLEDQIS